METRRAPTTQVITPPTVKETPFPPTEPVFVPDWPRIPPVTIPPVIIPPIVPPCDPDEDPHCEKPPEPPVDASEPGMLILLMIGGLLFWVYRRKDLQAS